MRINTEPKLNFEDVLLQPKRSTLSSRRDVDMTRKFTFRNSGKVMDFLPIFASNMDGVGTFSMAKQMQKHKMMTVITKSTTVDEWRAAAGTGLSADVVKIGIGPGSVCTTRTMTGVGVPQFSAIVDCSDAANGVGGHIMADGGCVHPGDIGKAFGGGAHMVMIGGMLAGHDESEQPVVDGKVEFYGMSSDRAREKHGKRKDGYRGNEGRLISLPHRGPVEATLEDILGGVRSACTYIGARRLKDMAKCASFVITNNVINRVYEQYTK